MVGRRHLVDQAKLYLEVSRAFAWPPPGARTTALPARTGFCEGEAMGICTTRGECLYVLKAGPHIT